MRVIISNDMKRLYGKIDHSILQKTNLSGRYGKTSTGIEVTNANGFSANDYVCVGNPGEDKSAILQIYSVSSNTINFTAGLGFEFDKRTPIYKLGYNQIRFYEDDSLLDTVNIDSDFWVELAHSVDTTKYYHITFYNSTTTEETDAGEKIKGYNRLLCSVGDIYQLEDACSFSIKIMDKIEFATREILSDFINQGQDISDLVNFEVLRISCATLSLHYYFTSNIKSENDVSSLKAKHYGELFKKKMIEAQNTINKQESQVSFWGQSRMDR